MKECDAVFLLRPHKHKNKRVHNLAIWCPCLLFPRSDPSKITLDDSGNKCEKDNNKPKSHEFLTWDCHPD